MPLITIICNSDRETPLFGYRSAYNGDCTGEILLDILGGTSVRWESLISDVTSCYNCVT